MEGVPQAAQPHRSPSGNPQVLQQLLPTPASVAGVGFGSVSFKSGPHFCSALPDCATGNIDLRCDFRLCRTNHSWSQYREDIDPPGAAAN